MPKSETKPQEDGEGFDGKPAEHSNSHPPSTSPILATTETKECAESQASELSIADVVCRHGRLNPSRADDMKRIDYVCSLFSIARNVAHEPFRLRTQKSCR